MMIQKYPTSHNPITIQGWHKLIDSQLQPGYPLNPANYKDVNNPWTCDTSLESYTTTTQTEARRATIRKWDLKNTFPTSNRSFWEPNIRNQPDPRKTNYNRILKHRQLKHSKLSSTVTWHRSNNQKSPRLVHWTPATQPINSLSDGHECKQ